MTGLLGPVLVPVAAALALAAGANAPAQPAAGPSRSLLEEPPPGRALRWRDLIRQEGRRCGFSASGRAFLAAQMMAESSGNPEADSGAASGLAQITAPTAADLRRWYPELADWGGPLDPRWALAAQCRLLKRWEARWRPRAADAAAALALAFGSYNAGYGWMLREARRCGARAGCDRQRWFEHIEREANCLRAARHCADTRRYIRRIFAAAPRYAGF